jgi:hypothetical protein
VAGAPGEGGALGSDIAPNAASRELDARGPDLNTLKHRGGRREKATSKEFAGKKTKDELADSSREKGTNGLAAGSPGTVESRGRTLDALDARTAALPMGSTVSTPTPPDPEGASCTPRPASRVEKTLPVSRGAPVRVR